jgi:hypothetical protein
MEHTITKSKEKITFADDKNDVELYGYAFIDKHGHCIVIVYGENRKDSTSKYLNASVA